MSADLRRRIAAGDRGALGEAFVLFRPLALKVLTQRRRHPADLDDLVQEAFMILPACARKCALETTLGGCVAAAAIQACRAWDAHKATHGHASRRVLLTAGELEGFTTPDPDPEDMVARRQRVHHLSELVEQLGPRQREALIARELHGLSREELAERLDTTPMMVSKNLNLARGRLVHLAAVSPLAEVFAAMPRRGDTIGSSRSARYRRRMKERRLTADYRLG